MKRRRPSIPPTPRSSRRRLSSVSPPATGRVLPVLVVYASVTAARDAITRVTRLVQARDPGAAVQPMCWRCDQLSARTWREMSLRDARRAQAIVLALEPEAELEAHVERWLGSLLERSRGANVELLALAGDDEAWTITLGQAQADETVAEVPAGAAPGWTQRPDPTRARPAAFAA